jgi:hypothetical protein
LQGSGEADQLLVTLVCERLDLSDLLGEGAALPPTMTPSTVAVVGAGEEASSAPIRPDSEEVSHNQNMQSELAERPNIVPVLTCIGRHCASDGLHFCYGHFDVQDNIASRLSTIPDLGSQSRYQKCTMVKANSWSGHLVSSNANVFAHTRHHLIATVVNCVSSGDSATATARHMPGARPIIHNTNSMSR